MNAAAEKQLKVQLAPQKPFIHSLFFRYFISDKYIDIKCREAGAGLAGATEAIYINHFNFELIHI